MKTTNNKTDKKNRSYGTDIARLAGKGLVLLFLVLSVLGCMTMEMSGAAPEAKGSMKAVSEAGFFRISIQSEVDPIPINSIHAWKLHIEDSDGKPVNDAEITIDGDMPAHGHGLPTEPKVTGNLGNGDYRVEGLNFQMQGDWVVILAISAGGKQDSVTLEFRL